MERLSRLPLPVHLLHELPQPGRQGDGDRTFQSFSRFIGLEKQNGAPGRIRTCDPQIRNLVLYPTELRARCAGKMGEGWAQCKLGGTRSAVAAAPRPGGRGR